MTRGKLISFALALCAATFASAQQWPIGDPAWYAPTPEPWRLTVGWGSEWIFPLFLIFAVVALGVGIFLLTHRGHGPHRWTRHPRNWRHGR
jgi:hypothetical protein